VPNTTQKQAHRKPTLTSYKADLVFEDGIPGLTVKKTLVDITIRNEFLPTYLSKEAVKLGAAAEIGEKEKNADFKEPIEKKLGFAFLPFAGNSMGHLRPKAEDLAYYLITQRAIHKGTTFNESATLFWHTWSFHIHRANARNILNRYMTISYKLPPYRKASRKTLNV
jgi:hypothetical protein